MAFICSQNGFRGCGVYRELLFPFKTIVFKRATICVWWGFVFFFFFKSWLLIVLGVQKVSSIKKLISHLRMAGESINLHVFHSIT